MGSIDPDNSPKPYDYFGMIGGTSIGGLIAIMLGRLQMTVSECIEEYKRPSPAIFTKLHHRSLKGRLQGRFNHKTLEDGIRALLERRNLDPETLFKGDLKDSKCKT
jgi:patatin-like phospholipase/acyl hydrolase